MFSSLINRLYEVLMNFKIMGGGESKERCLVWHKALCRKFSGQQENNHSRTDLLNVGSTKALSQSLREAGQKIK